MTAAAQLPRKELPRTTNNSTTLLVGCGATLDVDGADPDGFAWRRRLAQAWMRKSTRRLWHEFRTDSLGDGGFFELGCGFTAFEAC
jgi:hypothetical protein